LCSVRKAYTNGAVKKCLSTRSGRSILAGLKELAVSIVYAMATFNYLLKHPSRGPTGDGGIHTKGVRWVSKLVCQIVKKAVT